MFGIDSQELLVVAIVALVVIGPKELPGVLRTVGRWIASMRMMASEFRGHVDEMMRQSELDDLKKSVQDIKENSILDLQALDPTREIKDAIASGEAEATKAASDINQALTSQPVEPAPALAEAEVAALSGSSAVDEPASLPAPSEAPMELIPPSVPHANPEPVPAKTAA